MKSFWKGGTAFIWLTGLSTASGLLMIVALLLLIFFNGIGVFWPTALHRVETADGNVYLGEIWEEEALSEGDGTRIRLKIANRDFYGLDFRWINRSDISAMSRPDSAFLIERTTYGNFIGYLDALIANGQRVAEGTPAVAAALPQYLDQAHDILGEIHAIEDGEISDISYRIETLRLERKRAERENSAEEVRAIDDELAALQASYEQVEARMSELTRQGRAYELQLRSVDGRTRSLYLMDVVRAFQPNAASVFTSAGIYMSRAWEFLSDDPREANMEGGVFPAIFGTVLMVFIMSIAVVPLGVLTAVYLREYATQGPFVRAVRIAVNNLAGVPSIVFGIFGLGFFVYAVGGSIDQLFYPEALPTPTYGTGGILWASLTLALLTVPVVIVATEEGLAAVPRSIREGSLALGATKFETMWRIVLPSASPAILTGTILAIARAAGEVAPLMVTGVVKLAPSLPLDGNFPYLHLDRKFMHLGFHIYDVGFQSPNVEAALPMVYTTTLLLILIVVALNLAAILLRNRLHGRFAVGKI